MRRAAAAGLLLLAVAAAGMRVSRALRTDARSLAEAALRLEACADNPAEAQDALEKLMEGWEGVSSRMVILVGRGCTVPVEEALSRLKAAAIRHEGADIAMEAAALAVRLDHLWRSGALLWENIL